MAGTCSAISAARLGCKVALIQNRPVLGGNNSSEVRVHLNGKINLPYKDSESQQKTNVYIRQLVHFSQDSQRRGSRSRADLVMASWFPFPHVRFLERTSGLGVRVDYTPSFAGASTAPPTCPKV